MRRFIAAMASEQERDDRERDQRQRPVEPHHHDHHADQQHDRREDREEPVHGQRLDGEGVGGEPVEQIADLRAGCGTPARGAAGARRARCGSRSPCRWPTLIVV